MRDDVCSDATGSWKTSCWCARRHAVAHGAVVRCGVSYICTSLLVGVVRRVERYLGVYECGRMQRKHPRPTNQPTQNKNKGKEKKKKRERGPKKKRGTAEVSKRPSRAERRVVIVNLARRWWGGTVAAGSGTLTVVCRVEGDRRFVPDACGPGPPMDDAALSLPASGWLRRRAGPRWRRR